MHYWPQTTQQLMLCASGFASALQSSLDNDQGHRKTNQHFEGSSWLLDLTFSWSVNSAQPRLICSSLYSGRAQLINTHWQSQWHTSPRLTKCYLCQCHPAGAEIIKKKGRAGFAVGVSIVDVVHSIALDDDRILPVSSLQNGAYDINDVCLSVPTVVGRSGVKSHIEVDLWSKEKTALQKSGSVLRDTINKVLNG